MLKCTQCELLAMSVFGVTFEGLWNFDTCGKIPGTCALLFICIVVDPLFDKFIQQLK